METKLDAEHVEEGVAGQEIIISDEERKTEKRVVRKLDVSILTIHLGWLLTSTGIDPPAHCRALRRSSVRSVSGFSTDCRLSVSTGVIPGMQNCKVSTSCWERTWIQTIQSSSRRSISPM